jgi:hypothetical protein
MTCQSDTNILKRGIDWLAGRKLLNVVLVILYSLVILFLHDPMVKIVLQIKDHLTLSVFNYTVGIISIVILISFIAILLNRLLKNKHNRTLKLFFLFTTSGIMILHSQIMFEMSIEIIHSFEYAVLAFLLFPFFNRFGAAVIFAIPVMLIDEWLQYQVMYKGFVEYFELNDILMDIFGCGFMMITIWIFGIESKGVAKPFWKTSEYIFLCVLMVFVFASIATCFFSLYPHTECSNTWLVLNQLKNPDAFWQIHPVHGSEYHVMKPLEGIFAIILASLFFSSIDILKTKQHANLHTPHAPSVEN